MDKKKIKIMALFLLVIFYIVSMSTALFLSCQVADEKFMSFANYMNAAMTLEVESFEQSKDYNLFLENIKTISDVEEFPCCMIFTEHGKETEVLYSSVDDENSELYKECYNLSEKTKGQYSESYSTAYEVWNSIIFNEGDKEYSLALYSKENQILTAIKSEAFMVAFLILTITFTILFTTSQIRINFNFKRQEK